MNRIFMGLAAGVLACSVQAQIVVVPPPAAKRPDNSKELTAETAKNAALALPGVIFEGSAVLQHQMGQGGAVQALKAGKTASGILSYTVDGARLIGAAGKDGVEGLKAEVVQVGMERAAGAVGDIGATLAIRSAVVGGAGAVTAAGVAGVAYTGGSLVGGWARDSEWLGDRLGLERTLGHAVDEGWWRVTPDWTKEALSGTRQIDFDSSAFRSEMQADLARRKQRMAFERVQRENADQQRQAALAATASTPTGPAPSPSEGSGDTNGLEFLNQVNQSLLAIQAAQVQGRAGVSTPVARAPQQCRIDPKTGCHFGHDEKSHPGGCLCGR